MDSRLLMMTVDGKGGTAPGVWLVGFVKMMMMVTSVPRCVENVVGDGFLLYDYNDGEVEDGWRQGIDDFLLNLLIF